ncbi:MAG: class I SAM-dependent methyltransferase [Acidimicrobiales bacterium]
MTNDQLSRTVVACAWCGHPFDGTATHLALRTRCGACATATTDPFPSPDELEAAYGDWYRPPAARRFFFGVDTILARTRGLLAARIDRIAPPGPVLDVGAGDGILVDALRSRGRETVGLERNPNRSDLRDASLAELDGSYAAVIFWHSLEHLPDPADAVRQAARLLVPGGVIAVAVPNNDSIQAGLFGDGWLHLDIPVTSPTSPRQASREGSLTPVSPSATPASSAAARPPSGGSTGWSAGCRATPTCTKRCAGTRPVASSSPEESDSWPSPQPQCSPRSQPQPRSSRAPSGEAAPSTWRQRD